jgi:anaerobic selenocysteine-containing dehydrogenase
MPMDRRTFLKGAAAAAGAAAGTALPVISQTALAGRDYDIPASLPVDRVVRTTCSPNCTGSCGQLAFVRDGVLVKIQQAADFPYVIVNDDLDRATLELQSIVRARRLTPARQSARLERIRREFR